MAKKSESELLTQGLRLAERSDKVKDSQKMDYAQAYVQYFTVTKMADQKLRRLEALSHQEHYQGVLNYAYARAQKDIAKWKGVEYDHNKYGRFSTKPPDSLAMLNAKILDAQRFIDAPTSGKQGITQMYKKRADTMNKKYANINGTGAPLTWQDVANFFEKEYNEKLDGKVGSASQFVALGVMKRYGIDDSAIFEKVLKMRSDVDYASKVINNQGSGLSTKERADVLTVYNKIEADKNGKYVKSPKIQNDIIAILDTEGIDLNTLFTDSKKVKKKG